MAVACGSCSAVMHCRVNSSWFQQGMIMDASPPDGVAIHGCDSPQRKTGRLNHGKQHGKMQRNDEQGRQRSTVIRRGEIRKIHSPQRHRDHREMLGQNLQLLLRNSHTTETIGPFSSPWYFGTEPHGFLCALCVSVVKRIYMPCKPRSSAPWWISTCASVRSADSLW